MSDHGARLSSAESQAAKQSLTLAYSKGNPILFRQVMAEKLSIPQRLIIPEITRRPTQIMPDSLADSFVHTGRTSRTRFFLESGKTTVFKAPHPVLNGAGTVPEQFSDLIATQSGTHQQDPVQTVIIARILGSHDFILHCELHNLGILDLELTHDLLLSAYSVAEKKIMRKYL
jgi:hypothetical protein